MINFKSSFYIYFIPLFNFFTNLLKISNNKIKIKKIGIILQWGIGDSLIAYELLSGLKKKYPMAQIYIIGKMFNKDLFMDEIKGLEFIILDPPWSKKKYKYNFFSREYFNYFKTFIKIRKINLDLIVTPRFDFRDNIQLFFLNAKKFFTYKNSGLSKFFKDSINTNYLDYINTNCYVLIHNFCNHALGNKRREIFFKKNIHSKKINEWLSLRKLQKKKYVVFHGGASDSYREFCVDCQKSFLINNLKNKKVVIINDKRYDYSKIINLLDKNKIQYFIWSGSIYELSYLIRNASYQICMESGPLHLAYRYRIKTYCFFINKNQLINWAPIYKKNVYTYLHNKDCSLTHSYSNIKFNYCE